jgi:cell wall-associated NlpC family hydrolase
VPTVVLLLLIILVTAACGARGGVPRPFPGAAVPPAAGDAPTARAEDPAEESDRVPLPPVTTESGTLSNIIQTALDFLGVPYRNGGSDPSGFDCSGLMQWVFARHGTTLPREARDQYKVGRAINLTDVRPGDLIFFETVSRGASHVGMVIGEGRFVHAPSSNGVVLVEPYTAIYWIRRFVGARRVIDVDPSPEVASFPGRASLSR